MLNAKRFVSRALLAPSKKFRFSCSLGPPWPNVAHASLRGSCSKQIFLHEVYLLIPSFLICVHPWPKLFSYFGVFFGSYKKKRTKRKIFNLHFAMNSSNTHDNFVKSIFSNRDDAVSFFKSTLPEDLLAILNLDGLEQTKESFANKNLTQTDILWKIPTNAGEKIFVYLLFEHKSYYDPNIFLQVLGYLTQIYTWQKANQAELYPVIPFVFYHGEKKWDLGQKFSGQFKKGADWDNLKRFIPDFEVELFELEKRNIKLEFDRLSLRIFLSIIQKIRSDKDEFMTAFLEMILALGNEESQAKKVAILEKLIYYILSFRKGDEDEFRKSSYFKEIGMEKEFMTLLEKIQEEGKLEGIAEGLRNGKLEDAERMLARGISREDVLDITGLSEADLGEKGS